MPPLTLTHQEMTVIVRRRLAQFPSTFDFNSVVKSVASYLIKEGIGFKAESHTTYQPNMDWNGIALIREIIWDHIISRYVTVGGYGKDDWPNLMITQRGKLFFASV